MTAVTDVVSEDAASDEPAAAAGPAVPRLHLPEEPTGKQVTWRDQVLAGDDLAAVLSADEGLAAWLWSRWQVLAQVGLDRATFVTLVTAYRREVWLWLYGDRTWEQCCSGLIGRIERRLSR